MKPTVYLETTIIGYLASKLSRDLVTAANQQITQQWWDDHRKHYELYVSEPVVKECSGGNKQEAKKRLKLIEGIALLDVTAEGEDLAKILLKKVPLPKKAKVDALHIAIAAVNRMNFLVTWNCTHIANASWLKRINEICQRAGFESPTICTPQQLLEE